MLRYGYIRTKDEIKFLVLYAMQHLTEAVTYDVVIDLCTWCDDGFGYFELSEAWVELLRTGHVAEAPHDDEAILYEITPKGREAAELFERQLPFTVRESARRSALRVVRQLHRDAAIHTSVSEQSPGQLVVTLALDDVFSINMNVVSRSQAALLEKNFKAHAEKMYDVLLNALIDDYKDAE